MFCTPARSTASSATRVNDTPTLARLSRPYPALSGLRLTSVVPALSCQCPRCSFCPASLAVGYAPVSPSPRIIRLDAGYCYWGLQLIHWIHAVLGAVAVVPWNPKRQKNRSCLPPTWTAQELGKRTSIERFFGRVFLFFHLQRPPLCGWSALVTRVALTYTASIVVGLAAHQAGHPDLIRSSKRVLAHTWESF
jgi:hypothetical protein